MSNAKKKLHKAITEILKNYRTIVLTKDKKPKNICISAALLKDKDGVLIGTVRVSRDVT
jgi:vacuolar-type H+-ATPase subunit E/Vma4